MKFNIALCILMVFCTIHGSFAEDSLHGMKLQLLELKTLIKSTLQDLGNNKTAFELNALTRLAAIRNESLDKITKLTDAELSRNQDKINAAYDKGKDSVASCYVMVTPLLIDNSIYAKNYLEQLETRTTEAVEKILKKFDESEKDGYDLLDDIDDIIPSCPVGGDEEERCIMEIVDAVYEHVVDYVDDSLSLVNNTNNAIDHLVDSTKSISNEQVADVEESVGDTRVDAEMCLKDV